MGLGGFRSQDVSVLTPVRHLTTRAKTYWSQRGFLAKLSGTATMAVGIAAAAGILLVSYVASQGWPKGHGAGSSPLGLIDLGSPQATPHTGNRPKHNQRKNAHVRRARPSPNPPAVVGAGAGGGGAAPGRSGSNPSGKSKPSPGPPVHAPSPTQPSGLGKGNGHGKGNAHSHAHGNAGTKGNGHGK